MLTAKNLAEEISDFLRPIKSRITKSNNKVAFVFIGEDETATSEPGYPYRLHFIRDAHISISTRLWTSDASGLNIAIHWDYDSNPHSGPRKCYSFDIFNPDLFKIIKTKVIEIQEDDTNQRGFS